MTFPISETKRKSLEKKMIELGIRDADLKEEFVRSGGHGGQNVNKLSTCVVLTHQPSGLVIKCQEERSQGLNRYLARKRLVEKLEMRMKGRQSAQAQERYKIRRQKKRRSCKTKEKLRKLKEVRSKKKQLRSQVKKENE